MSLDIRSTLVRPLPLFLKSGKGRRIPFEKIANAILGSRYDLSLVVCSDSLAQKMNARYRRKTYKPNVLSFPISKTEGEIFLNVRCAEREARRYGVSPEARLALLFVHGCYHLKGLAHGRIMEGLERRTLRRFGF
jgi:rRNA maturation RNase YbeY